MQTVLIVAAAIAAVFAVTFVSAIISDRKLKKLLRLGFGVSPRQKYDEERLESIAACWQQKRAHTARPVDDTTWADLDMTRVFMRLNATSSSVGEEYLYAALHDQAYHAEKLAEFEQSVQFFDTHDAQRAKVQFYLAKLGKVTGNGLFDFITHPAEETLGYSFIYPILSLLALLSICTLFFDPRTGGMFLILMFIVNLVVYFKTKYNLEAELVSVHYIASMTAAAKSISKMRDPELGGQTERLRAACSRLRSLGRLTGSILKKSNNDLAFILEYIKIFFLLDFVMYNIAVGAVKKHQRDCVDIYDTLGLLDTALAVASYRRSVPFYTTPSFAGEDAVTMAGVVHPLLDDPVPNTVALGRSALITGSNASGKSTFVKAVAINAILAQTINTCLAEKFRFRPSFVVTSMAVSDNLALGDSYYIAEIKSLKRVLDGLSGEVRCLCFIDEILKGTNTIERIAASAAILHHLSGGNCLAMIATHDIELTEMMAEDFDNYHFQEHITDSGIHFDYKIYEGWTTTKNAVRLLSFMDYDPQITEMADRLAAGFEKNRVWPRLTQGGQA